MRIRSIELEDGITVEYRKEGVLINQGTSSVLVTESQLKIILQTLRDNSKSNGIVESKEKV